MSIIETSPIEETKVAQIRSSIAAATGDSKIANFIATALAQGKTLTSTEAQLTSTQAARIIGVSRPFVCQLMDAGLLHFTWVGRKRRTTLLDVKDYLERRDKATQEYVTHVSNRSERLHHIADSAADLTDEDKRILQEL